MCYIGVLIPGITVFRWGSDAQRDFIRDQVMTGRHRLAVGLSEPDSGSDAAALRTTAEDHGDHFVVRGQKAWCTGGGLPDTTIATYVRTGPREPKHGGISLLLVDPATDGVEVRRTPTLARHILGTNEVFFHDAPVPKENLVGPLDEGWKVMLSNIELEKVIISGGYLGAAQATLDEMLEYARTRHAFGRPIGNFQALAHAMADLQTEIDSARLLAYRAAWLLAQGKPCTREGSMAKLKGSETYVAAARLGMQVLAGHGFSTESVMSFRYRESIVATISGGTSQIQRNGIARSMGLRSY
jgi:alkylation response protein AidB-like acyl-CoA dehydrogenase